MEPLLLTVSWVLIIASVLPFVRREAWWIRVFDFPRTQILIAALTILPVQFFLHGDGAFHAFTLILLALCAGYQCWEMSAYTRLRPVQSMPYESDDPERRLRILTANVLMTNRNFDAYLRIIRREDPDLVVLAEPDPVWEEALRVIEPDYSWTMKCPIANTYGMLLYSRLPLEDQQIRFRVEEDVPSFSAFVRLRTGDRVELHCIHPRPPHVGVDTVERDAELVLVAKEVRNSPHPIIVTGDLNDVAWSHTTRLFLRISGLLDPRLGRTFCNTFHAGHPLLRWPLDHLFHSRAFRLVRMSRLEKTGSDHFPVLVDLSFEPEVRHDQERPEADREDFQEAVEKIETAREKED
jgi:endonuclease/exonuclease/phosphatase (EEP) superfamily protein YafD